jgi:hypothetical protein
MILLLLLLLYCFGCDNLLSCFTSIQTQNNVTIRDDIFKSSYTSEFRSQWPRGLRRRSAEIVGSKAGA